MSGFGWAARPKPGGLCLALILQFSTSSRQKQSGERAQEVAGFGGRIEAALNLTGINATGDSRSIDRDGIRGSHVALHN
jgi:hypothetical protein